MDTEIGDKKPELETQLDSQTSSTRHSDTILLKNIFIVRDYGRAVLRGLCKLAPAGIAYKSVKGTVIIKKDQISRTYLSECGSSRTAGEPVLELSIIENNGVRTDIRGISEDLQEKLRDYIHEKFDLDTETIRYESKGWNYGDLNLDDGCLTFKTDDGNCTSFNVPFSQIKNVSSNRQELMVEIVKPTMMGENADDRNQSKSPHGKNDHELNGGASGNSSKSIAIFELKEMRFHVPGSGEIGERAIELKERIAKNINMRQSDDIMTISNIKGIIPRGTFEIRFGLTCMNMRGASYNYTVFYNNISRMFALDIPQGRSEGKALIINLSRSIRQGQTEYDQLRFDFYQDEDDETFDINLSEEDAKDKFGEEHINIADPDSDSDDDDGSEMEIGDDNNEDNENKNHRRHKKKKSGLAKYIFMTGTPYTCMCIVLRSLVGKNITISLGFRGFEGTFMTCLHRASQSFLYPLKNAIFLMSRPCIYIRHTSIKRAQFLNVNPTRPNTRGKFDLQVVPISGNKILFEDIDYREFNAVKQYLTNNNISADVESNWSRDQLGEFVEEDTDESDEDYNDDPKGTDENMDAGDTSESENSS